MSRMIYWPVPILILLLCILSTAQAERVRIFEIHKNLPMSASEVSLKDYYLTGGRDVGLKENMIVTVYRAKPLHDHTHNEPRGNFKFRVGQLKLILVSEQNSVARSYRMVDAKVAPILEFEAFQVGDMVELTDAYFEKSASVPVEGSNNHPEAQQTAAAPTPEQSKVVAQITERTPNQVVDLKAGTSNSSANVKDSASGAKAHIANQPAAH